MELEPTQEFRLKGQVRNEQWRRSKTSLRINYEAQVQIIKHQIGGLEEVRQKLGLNARKMSQLLLVDPSAWTRWTREGGDPPPHIWRALQWYLALFEKVPGLTPGYFLSRPEVRVVERAESGTDEKLQVLKHQLERKYERLMYFSCAGWASSLFLLFWLLLK